MMQDDLLQQAAAAARTGDSAGARRILSELVRQYPGEARAWYLLSQLVEQPERAEFCLKKVLEIDPQNTKARQRLEAAQQYPALQDTALPAAAVPPAASWVQQASAPAVPSQAAEPAGPVKLPPWLAATPEQAAPIRPLVEPPAPPFQPAWLPGSQAQDPSEALYNEREEIQGIPSSYTPPAIPGMSAVEMPSTPAKAGLSKKAPQKRKEKKDYFGFLVIGATILALLCICGCIAFVYGGEVMTSVLGSQLALPDSVSIPEAESYKITYKIEGSGAAHVAYANSKGDTTEKTVNLPYTNTMSMSKGMSLSVIAQSLEKKSIHCAIVVNGKEVTRDTVQNAGITMCYGLLP